MLPRTLPLIAASAILAAGPACVLETDCFRDTGFYPRDPIVLVELSGSWTAVSRQSDGEEVYFPEDDGTVRGDWSLFLSADMTEGVITATAADDADFMPYSLDASLNFSPYEGLEMTLDATPLGHPDDLFYECSFVEPDLLCAGGVASLADLVFTR